MSAALPQPPSSLLLGLSVLLVAVPGVAAIWTGVAVIVGGSVPWMAMFAAGDAALLLRLANLPTGPRRALWGLGVVVLTIVVAALFVATARVGMNLGLRPAEALGKMSFGLAWLWLTSNWHWADVLWCSAGAALGWRLSR